MMFVQGNLFEVEVFVPPTMEAMKMKLNTQIGFIYYELMATYPGNVSLGPLLDASPTNHRARICRIRKKLQEAHIIAEFGRWDVKNGKSDTEKSLYRLIRI